MNNMLEGMTVDEQEWHDVGSAFSDRGPGMSQGWNVSLSKCEDETFQAKKWT
jgi:hypothetical protein